MSNVKNPQIEMYAKTISEQAARERVELIEEAKSLHMSSAYHGPGHVHISDMPHNKKSVSHIEKGIGERLHKAHPDVYKSAEHATSAYRDAHSEEENEGFGHHNLASAKDRKEKPVASMSSKKYMDSEAKHSHKHVKNYV